MSVRVNRGSEWHRWDLHVHTPGTLKNDQYVGGTIEEKWDGFYRSISEYVGDATDPLKDIVAIGITDYLSIDNYQRVVKENRLPNSIKLVIPNVELRLRPVSAKRAVNIHCIFSPSITDDLETRFFAKLSFRYRDRDYGATHSELIQLGRAYMNNPNLDSIQAYKAGIEQFIIDVDSLANVFEKDPELKESTIVVVANSSNDGASGIVRHSDYFTENGSQLDATRQRIYQLADMVFSGQEKDVQYFLGQGVDTEEMVKQKCGSIKACIHGSDAHTNGTLFEPSEQRYCWIKALPTFNGLMQVLYEPEARVRISPVIPETKPDYQVIDHIEIIDKSFSPEHIAISPQLTCIIGGKSTGKSLLLHNIARAIDEEQVVDKARITHEKIDERGLSGIKVVWADGTVSSGGLNTDHKIIYIPQTYLNRLSDEQEELTEIDQIIHGIVMINPEAKSAYENMMRLISENKLAVDKAIYDLVQLYDKVRAKIDEIAEIGTREGITKEVKKLRSQKDKQSKGLSLTDEQIQAYDESVSFVNTRRALLSHIDDEITGLRNMTAVIEPVAIPEGYSEQTKVWMSSVVAKVTEAANALWQEERDKYVSEIHLQVDGLQKEQDQRQSIIDQLQPIISENEAIKVLSETIQQEEEKLRRFTEETRKLEELRKNYASSLQSLVLLFLGYEDIHRTFEQIVNSISDLKGEALKFSVETPFRTEAFANCVQSLFDRRSMSRTKDIVDIDTLSYSWINEDSISRLIEACLNGTLRPTKGRDVEAVLRDLLKDWFNSAYKVQMDGDLIDDMSPGKKALVLLEMLINLAESKCPILIDQPEDDLDNRSIFDELIPFIKRKKLLRQIIIVTHNANVVLGGDADEVIVANQDGKNSPNRQYKFEYKIGAIEDDLPSELDSEDVLSRQGIQQHICDILEGGKRAFDLRKNKYHI